MTMDTRARFPYYPQRGDEIVVCRRGYEDYLHEIQAMHMWTVPKMAWPSADFEQEERAIVEEVGKPLSITIMSTDDRIQAIIDNHWYFGTVVANLVLRTNANNTAGTSAQPDDRCNDMADNGHWLSLEVAWQNESENDRISPWDVQMYNEDADRLLSAVAYMCELKRFESFVGAVPLDVYADYATVVPYCIDLDKIKIRLQNGFYRYD
ncbi:unnamed protein product [Sphagnum balticum]